MSQFPPASGHPQRTLEPHPRGNPAALTSLILGILGCVPVVTGVLAILLGAYGLHRSRDPRAGGRAFAIAGLSLGIASLAFWGYLAATVGMTWASSRPQRAMTRQFMQYLTDRNIPAAMAISAPTLGQDHVEIFCDRLSPLGALKDLSFPSVYFQNVNGTEQWVLVGKAIYSNGDLSFNVTTVRTDEGWKVYRLQLPRQIKLTSYSTPATSQPSAPRTQPIGP